MADLEASLAAQEGQDVWAWIINPPTPGHPSGGGHLSLQAPVVEGFHLGILVHLLLLLVTSLSALLQVASHSPRVKVGAHEDMCTRGYVCAHEDIYVHTRICMCTLGYVCAYEAMYVHKSTTRERVCV